MCGILDSVAVEPDPISVASSRVEAQPVAIILEFPGHILISIRGMIPHTHVHTHTQKIPCCPDQSTSSDATKQAGNFTSRHRRSCRDGANQGRAQAESRSLRRQSP